MQQATSTAGALFIDSRASAVFNKLTFQKNNVVSD
jgi:hypothetical protein